MLIKKQSTQSMLYRLSDFTQNISKDITGGLTAGVVALPLALAFGIASGAGAMAGLYGAIVLGILAAIFGGTRQQISGPTGPMTVVMTTVIMDFTVQFPEQWLGLAFTTVILAGLMQILFGILRIGKYIVMVPYPVISGFMSGIGLIIIVLQIPVLLGFAVPSSLPEVFSNLHDYVQQVHLPTLWLGIAGILIQILWRGPYAGALPPALVALVAVTIISIVTVESDALLRIGELPSGLPPLVMPTFEWSVLELMLMNAFMLAVLGAIDSLLTSLVLDNESGEQHDSDQELIGQGIGNACAGLLGALPGAGATMRSMINIKAGGQGPLAGVVHGLLLLLVVLGLGFMFSEIPQVVLAAILLKVGIDIIDWPFLKKIHRLPLFPVCLMFLVLGLTLFVDLITAVLVGVFIKNIDTVKRLSDLQLGDIILSDGKTDAQLLCDMHLNYLSEHPNTVLLKITGPMSYAVGRGLKKRYRNFASHEHLIVDLNEARIVGYSTSLILYELVKKAVQQGQSVVLVGVDDNTRKMLGRLGIREVLAESDIRTGSELPDLD